MGRFEVRGIVSSKTGKPLIQLCQVNDDMDEVIFQVSPREAREIAGDIFEAAANAIYDAAFIDWVKETFPNNEMMEKNLVALIREYRGDKWELPDHPKGWIYK